jgi:F-type H+-transporting ATPase subunit b
MRRLLIAGVVASLAVGGVALGQGETRAQVRDQGVAAAAGGEEVGTNAEPEDPSEGFNWTGLSYSGKDQEGGPLGDGKIGTHAPKVDPDTGEIQEEEPMPAPFLYLVGNFLLILLILAWKAGPKIGQAARDRSDQIKSALDEAARLRDEARAKLDEYDAKLKAAEAEIATMVEGMRADAEADKKRIIGNAEAQAAALKKDAEERIAAEIRLARVQLAREVAYAAARAAEALIEQKATKDDQARLVATFIEGAARSGRPEETA